MFYYQCVIYKESSFTCDSSNIGMHFKFTVIVIGEMSVGKTSILQRYCKDIFEEKFKTTVVLDTCRKVIEVDGNCVEVGLIVHCMQKMYVYWCLEMICYQCFEV